MKLKSIQKVSTPTALFLCGVVALGALIVSLAMGAYQAGISFVLSAILNFGDTQNTDALIFWNIRFPRVLLAFGIGACLAVSGAMAQAFFKNPLADAQLMGVSSGATLGGVSYYLWVWPLLQNFSHSQFWMSFLLPVSALIGCMAILIPLTVYSVRTVKVDVGLLLLVGLAINSYSGALTGFALSVYSTETQLRSITFWLMGSVSSADWIQVSIVYGVLFVFSLFIPRYTNGLNLLTLGDAQAECTGLEVKKTQGEVLFWIAILTSVSVCFTGMIGFIGLMIPHMIRMLWGGNHVRLLPASIFIGGIVLCLSDTLARTLISPAELPLGVLTALIGSPFFVWILYKQRQGRRL